jgi:tRNA guanosine-2'-O-methyltransferase
MSRQPLRRSTSRHDYHQLPRYPLMVCATLVQSAVNLGGLCRTSEAFRLEALVLSDLKISHDPAFKNLAASSHHWQPLQACSVTALPDWLTQQQQAGYSIVALTAPNADAALSVQDRYQSLFQFQFSTQTILLLGQELTGIPDAILSLADQRLVIPQFGLVESLNVQTAAAIAIYEYVRQQESGC